MIPDRDTEIERIDPEPMERCCSYSDCGCRYSPSQRGAGHDHARTGCVLRSQPASEPSLDVERLARAMVAWWNAPRKLWPAIQRVTEDVLAEDARMIAGFYSQPADMSRTHDRDNEATATPESDG